MSQLPSNFDDQLQQEGFSKAFGGQYTGTALQQEKYQLLEKNDAMYKRFIAENYGSYENFMTQNRIAQASAEFDPRIDHVMDVTIVTSNASYKSDHISSQEVIMEALSGICTVVFMKVDGSVGRITGTLDMNYIPLSEKETRRNFFTPLAKDRIVMWDINKQGWRSFYMDNAIKFVRDDTTDLE
jgi:hypothetical protein